jgi:hypothetical protein
MRGVLRGLALGIVEIRGNRDDGFGDRLAEVTFGDVLHRAQHHARNFGRRHPFAGDLEPGVAVLVLDDSIGDTRSLLLDLGAAEFLPHQPFDGVDGVFRVGRGLALGHLTDQTFAARRERHDRRGGARTFRVGDYPDLRLAARRAALEHRDARVGRAQVDAHDLRHRSGQAYPGRRR